MRSLVQRLLVFGCSLSLACGQTADADNAGLSSSGGTGSTDAGAGGSSGSAGTGGAGGGLPELPVCGLPSRTHSDVGSVTLAVRSIRIPTDAGFDLDCCDGGDCPTACPSRPDTVNGVDNAFADPIRELLVSAEAGLPDPDEEANFAIGAGDWTWILELDVAAHQMRVTQGTRLGSPPTWTESEEWSRQGQSGWVEAVELGSGWFNLEPLVLHLPLDAEHLGVKLEIVLAHVLVSHDIGSWRATLGGELDPGILNAAIYDLLAHGDPNRCPNIPEEISQQYADVGLHGTRCSRVSFGANLELAPVTVAGVEPFNYIPSVCF